LGFVLGLTIVFNSDGAPIISDVTPEAIAHTDVVYVAMLPSGKALKVGVSKKGARSRWAGILSVMDITRWPKLKPNQQNDGRRLLLHAAGTEFTVWVKPSLQILIPYAAHLMDQTVSARHAEEIFLDRYYQPLFGQRL